MIHRHNRDSASLTFILDGHLKHAEPAGANSDDAQLLEGLGRVCDLAPPIWFCDARRCLDVLDETEAQVMRTSRNISACVPGNVKPGRYPSDPGTVGGETRMGEKVALITELQDKMAPIWRSSSLPRVTSFTASSDARPPSIPVGLTTYTAIVTPTMCVSICTSPT